MTDSKRLELIVDEIIKNQEKGQAKCIQDLETRILFLAIQPLFLLKNNAKNFHVGEQIEELKASE